MSSLQQLEATRNQRTMLFASRERCQSCPHVARVIIAGGQPVFDNHGPETSHGKHAFVRGQRGFLHVAYRDYLLTKENNSDQLSLGRKKKTRAQTAESVYRKPRNASLPLTLGIDPYR